MVEDKYAERLAALREENEFLRQAARTFGELAERLSNELHALRRESLRNPPRARLSVTNKSRVPSSSAFR
jgi:hypothetical protein